ncbi:MAG: VWA domain-containing protein [Candidatus Hydrogenedentes bacterium]|nr:VWA domain-containing protein [Candidatus Hydrogenedentota bacterium]
METIKSEDSTVYSSGFPGIAGQRESAPSESTITIGKEVPFVSGTSRPTEPAPKPGQLLEQESEIVEARNRLEIRANLNDGLSLSYETDGGASGEPVVPSAPPETEQWAEYNVGNLTGQTEISELASNIPDDEATGLRLGADRDAFREPWKWNTPDNKPTEIVGGPGTETYVKVAGVKPFLAVRDEPLSTFSIDVDTAAYSNVRRFLNQGHLPPPDAVRIEEMINYFAYAYPQPVDGRPFAVNVMGAPAPWAPQHRLVRIGIKGLEVPQSERPPANLVFLLDVSGSMGDANKLPLVKESMKTLLGQLRPNDRVAIVTYAGDARKVLDPTPCSERGSIVAAIDSLRAGGSTNGAGGIEMAYDLAQSGFIRGGINRVIIATDGDFNVGVTSHGGLMSLIEARAKSGVFLTALGFGMGNLKDATLEQLANRGNGNYAYIDNHAEARRALVDQLAGTLQTIAKDVKIQVEFNPARVSHYRLLGYENRALANRDFNDDTKDAGEIGAGHTVTALYEIIPAGSGPAPGVDPLKYQAVEPDVDSLKYGAAPAGDRETPILPGPEPTPRPDIAPLPEWLTVKLRYKEPEASESTRLDVPLATVNNDLREADADFRFASAVAAFGQVLRHSGYRHPSNFDRIIEMARAASNGDPDREAFVDLVITAKTLTGSR